MSAERGLAAGKYVCRFDGYDLPVTHLFRGDDEVADLGQAFAFVAGPRADGMWIGAAVSEYELAPVN